MKVNKSRMPGVPDEQWDYKPRIGFVNNMKNLLQLLRSDDSKPAGKENNIRRMKNYYLPLIFQAMADLTFFFEAISQNPELQKAFQLELMDLLGVKRLDPRKNPHGFMFQNLVAGMLCTGYGDDDFTVRFIDTLERLIWIKVSKLRIFETLKSSTKVIQEIGGPMAWTELLASRIPDVYDFNILTKGIPGKEFDKDNPGGTFAEREIAFEEEANVRGNKPDRTFKFNTSNLLN